VRLGIFGCCGGHSKTFIEMQSDNTSALTSNPIWPSHHRHSDFIAIALFFLCFHGFVHDGFKCTAEVRQHFEEIVNLDVVCSTTATATQTLQSHPKSAIEQCAETYA
jgi:hypothetical protein